MTEQYTKQQIIETDNFIIKMTLILFISIIAILVTLILLKYAIEKKFIYKLSHYV